jgi:hypothetical protein
MILTNRLLMVVVSLGLFGVCSSGFVPGKASAGPVSPPKDSSIAILGTVTYLEFEGGFFGIRGDDGRDYLPLGLDERFRKHGLRVRFEGRRMAVMTIQQWGTPVRIESISTITPDEPVYRINGSVVRINEPGQDGTVSLASSVMGDLNNDGLADHGAVLRLNSKGSGVFYHLNVFLKEDHDGWRFVSEEFLGDRIKLDFMDIYRQGSVSSVTGVPIHPDDHGQLVVAYSIHSREQSYSDAPRLYITKHWRVEGGKLVLIENY